MRIQSPADSPKLEASRACLSDAGLTMLFLPGLLVLFSNVQEA